MSEESSHSKFSVAIIGAGPAGLTAAHELTLAGHDVTVLERDPEYVGGMSKTVRHNGYHFDIGGHRFFSKAQEVEDFWRRILPDDFLDRPRKSRIFYKGQLFSYPLKPMDALTKLGFFESIRCVLSYGLARLKPIPQPRNFEEWVINQFGRRLFVLQVQGSQRRSQPPGAQRQLKVPDGRKDRPEHAAQCNHGRVRWRTPRQARDDVHGHLMQVFHQVHRRFEDAPGLPVGRILNGARQVGFGALSIEVGERPALVGIVYHDPPPALRIGAGGRLYGEFQAFVDDCSGHGFVQVQTLANRAGGGEQRVRHGDIEFHRASLLLIRRPELWGRRLVTATQSPAPQPHHLLFGMPFR